MLKSYEAIYENGQVKWLGEQPEMNTGQRIIITFLEETQPQVKRHFPVTDMVGKAKTVGDIVSPIVDEEDWECLK